jgi:hypothetical protein
VTHWPFDGIAQQQQVGFDLQLRANLNASADDASRPKTYGSAAGRLGRASTSTPPRCPSRCTPEYQEYPEHHTGFTNASVGVHRFERARRDGEMPLGRVALELTLRMSATAPKSTATMPTGCIGAAEAAALAIPLPRLSGIVGGARARRPAHMTLFVTVLRTAELASAKKDGSIVAELTLVGDETGSKPAVLCAHTLHTTMRATAPPKGFGVDRYSASGLEFRWAIACDGL